MRLLQVCLPSCCVVLCLCPESVLPSLAYVEVQTADALTAARCTLFMQRKAPAWSQCLLIC